MEEALWEAVLAARDQTEREARRYASRPAWDVYAEVQRLKRRRREQEEDQRVTDLLARGEIGQTPMPPAKPRYATAQRRKSALEGDARGRERAENEERRRLQRTTIELLREIDAPSLEQVAGCQYPDSALEVIVKGKRAATLRGRVRDWKRIRDWLSRTHGNVYPRCWQQLLETKKGVWTCTVVVRPRCISHLTHRGRSYPVPRAQWGQTQNASGGWRLGKRKGQQPMSARAERKRCRCRRSSRECSGDTWVARTR